MTPGKSGSGEGLSLSGLEGLHKCVSARGCIARCVWWARPGEYGASQGAACPLDQSTVPLEPVCRSVRERARAAELEPSEPSPHAVPVCAKCGNYHRDANCEG